MQIINSIISACSFLLLLFSLHLFYARQGNRLLNRLLSVLLFARFGQIIVYLMISSNQIDTYPFFHKLFTPFYYATPAFFYLYITGFINDRTHFRKFDWIHFIPIVIAIIDVLPWNLSYPVAWDQVADQISANKQLFMTHRTGLLPASFHYIGRPVLTLGYLIAAWYVMLTSTMIKHKEWPINKIWIFFCLSTATFFRLVSMLPIVFGGLKMPYLSGPWFFTVNCIVLLCILIFILHQPRLLYGYLFVSADWRLNITPAKNILQPDIPEKLNLFPEKLESCTEEMKKFMETEKPFLHTGFQIIHLAQKLDIPVHHCSFAINTVIGKNFRDWVNAYRVNAFIDTYPQLADKMTIEAIAHRSGFKSVATFYNAFKKETGLIPTVYFSKRGIKSA